MNDDLATLLQLMRDPPCQLCRATKDAHAPEQQELFASDHTFLPPTMVELADWFEEVSSTMRTAEINGFVRDTITRYGDVLDSSLGRE